MQTPSGSYRGRSSYTNREQGRSCPSDQPVNQRGPLTEVRPMSCEKADDIRRVDQSLPLTSKSQTGFLQKESVGEKRSAGPRHRLEPRSNRTPGTAPKRLLAVHKQKKLEESTTMTPQKASSAKIDSTKTPASTVAQAQELGQQARLRDDIVWYIQGLSSATSRHSSLSKLVEIYSNRRNRVALQTNAIGNDVVHALAKLHLQGDALTALGIATILLMLAYPSGNPLIFSDAKIASILANLLQCDESLPEKSNASPAAVRILHVLMDGPVNRILPREAAHSPLAVCLLVLTSTLDPQNTTSDIDKLKISLRENGVLQAVAQVAAVHGHALGEASPTMSTVHALWHLHHALIVLEHSSFACRSNEDALACMQVTMGMSPVVARISLPALLVQQLQDLVSQPLTEGLKKDCLRSILAVLTNITQSNEAGCMAVSEAGGVEVACHAFHTIIWRSKMHIQGRSSHPSKLDSWVDELTVSLGLLINLVEQSMTQRVRMRSVYLSYQEREDLKNRSCGTSESANVGGITMIQLLAQLMGSVASKSDESQGLGADGDYKDEVTLETLNKKNREASGSIIELYSAVLLGFLVEGDRKAQEQAADRLPGGKLSPVVSAIRRCLGFYLATGALTKETEDSLRNLLASLEQSSYL